MEKAEPIKPWYRAACHSGGVTAAGKVRITLADFGGTFGDIFLSNHPAGESSAPLS
jgi:hypothetical protein